MSKRIFVALLVGLLSGAPAFGQWDTRTSTANGVTIKVTPKALAADAAAWQFAIVLDTHSQDLSDDLAKAAVLIGPGGERYAPVAWEGAPAGGHHREGVLRFQAIRPFPAITELQIQRPGESAPRVFRWDLNSK
jgi:hypothetical protein